MGVQPSPLPTSQVFMAMKIKGKQRTANIENNSENFEKIISPDPVSRSGKFLQFLDQDGLELKPVQKKLSMEQEQFLT